MTRSPSPKRTKRHTAPREPATTGPHTRLTDYPLADTAPRWYSQADLARATGLPERTIRDLLDRGRIYFWQGQPNEKRLLNDRTISSLEALGIPVRRDLLGNPGRPGEIRAQDDETGE